MPLSREAILSADDLPRELVAVPEWGGDVYVKTLGGTERDAYEQSLIKGKGRKREMSLDDARAKLCAASICDENGTVLFTERDVGALGRKSSKALDRVFAVAQRLSGISDADVEELVGNSQTPLDGGSTTK